MSEGGCGLLGSLLEQIEPDQLALLASLFAIAIADGLTPDETNAFGNFIVAMGSIMLTIAAQQELQSKGVGSAADQGTR